MEPNAGHVTRKIGPLYFTFRTFYNFLTQSFQMKILCGSLETNQLAILDSERKAKHLIAFEQGADESLDRSG